MKDIYIENNYRFLEKLFPGREKISLYDLVDKFEDIVYDLDQAEIRIREIELDRDENYTRKSRKDYEYGE